MKRDKRQVRGFQEWQPAFARSHIRTVGSPDATKHSETYQESVRNIVHYFSSTVNHPPELKLCHELICLRSFSVEDSRWLSFHGPICPMGCLYRLLWYCCLWWASWWSSWRSLQWLATWGSRWLSLWPERWLST